MRSLAIRDPKIKMLAEMVSRWGGSVIKVSERDFRKIPWNRLRNASEYDWYLSPFSRNYGEFGVNFDDKTIVYFGDVSWVDILHEMGHIFATSQNPERCKEEDFIGWEYAIGKSIDLDEWIEDNAEYMLDVDGEDKPIAHIPRDALIRRLDQYLAAAKKCKLFKYGKPTTLRGCSRCRF